LEKEGRRLFRMMSLKILVAVGHGEEEVLGDVDGDDRKLEG
jgi:hypothetical protein